jgi:hypothetical protein
VFRLDEANGVLSYMGCTSSVPEKPEFSGPGVYEVLAGQPYLIDVAATWPGGGVLDVSIDFEAGLGPEYVPVTVDLALRKHLIARGTVSAGSQNCFNAAQVWIEKRTPSGWSRFARADFGPDGRFRLPIADLPGRYRAKIDRYVETDYVCRGARSAIVRHRH